MKEYYRPMKYALGGHSRGTANPGVKAWVEPQPLDRPKSTTDITWVMGKYEDLIVRYPHSSFSHVVREVYGGWVDKRA